MSNMKTNGKILSLLMAAALALGVFAGMPITASAAPIGLSAPEAPHWETNENGSYTGNAVWNQVPESGDETHERYKYRVYYRADDQSPPDENNDGGWIEAGSFWTNFGAVKVRWSLSDVLDQDGYYYFSVCALGDGVNYTDSAFVFAPDPLVYTAPSEQLPIPIGLYWGKDEYDYFAVWDNLFTDDYEEEDSFTVYVYDRDGEFVEGNTFSKKEIMDEGYLGIPILGFEEEYGTYRFTVQAHSSRPNEYRSSEVSAYSPWKTIPEPVYTGGGSGGRSSSGSKGTTASSSAWTAAASTPASTTITTGTVSATSRATGEATVQAVAWKQLSGSSFRHDTVANGVVQVRLTIGSPGDIGRDLKVSGYVAGTEVQRVGSIFEKHFSNKTSILHFDQAGAWGQAVRVAAKLDLSGMDTDNLVFYAYDRAANQYRLIPNPEYRIDSNGYLHFSTPYAGSIVVSDGALVKK